MLVLSRKLNESIIIGAGTPYETEVMVVEVSGGKVRLGFDAPPDVRIYRKEIQDMKDELKRTQS